MRNYSVVRACRERISLNVALVYFPTFFAARGVSITVGVADGGITQTVGAQKLFADAAVHGVRPSNIFASTLHRIHGNNHAVINFLFAFGTFAEGVVALLETDVVYCRFPFHEAMSLDSAACELVFDCKHTGIHFIGFRVARRVEHDAVAGYGAVAFLTVIIYGGSPIMVGISAGAVIIIVFCTMTGGAAFCFMVGGLIARCASVSAAAAGAVVGDFIVSGRTDDSGAAFAILRFGSGRDFRLLGIAEAIVLALPVGYMFKLAVFVGFVADIALAGCAEAVVGLAGAEDGAAAVALAVGGFVVGGVTLHHAAAAAGLVGYAGVGRVADGQAAGFALGMIDREILLLRGGLAAIGAGIV